MRISGLLFLLIAVSQSALAQPNIDALVQTLRSNPQDALRENAAHTLGQIALILGPVQAAPALPALLDAVRTDRAPAVRREASIAITSIGTSPPVIPFYIVAMRTVSDINAFDTARAVVTSYVNTASPQDIANLKILDNLRAYRDSLYSLPRSNGKATRLDDIFLLFASTCQRSPSDQAGLIADFRQTLDRFAPIPSNQRDMPWMRPINGLSSCGSDGAQALLDATQQFALNDKIDTLVSLQTTWPSYPSAFIQQEQSRLLSYAMDVLNTFPDSWNCKYAVSIPTFKQLGPFAAPAAAKLRMVAALSQQASSARYGFPVCGQAEAQDALQSIQ